MHLIRQLPKLFAIVSMGMTFALPAHAAENPPKPTAGEIAARLSALRQDGTSYVRLRMEIKGPAPATLQLQVKQRRSKDATDVVYQVLFPKERKGESILLRKSGNRAAAGSILVPPGKLRPIDDLKEPLFGSDLCYEDVVDDFYAWDQQAITGAEDVDGVSCEVLESKPGKDQHSIYGSVKSWVDTRRMVPLRVEKYSPSGKIVRRIDSTRVVADAGRQIPANITVRSGHADAMTFLDGSRIRHDVTFTDKEFTPEGLGEIAIPRGAPE